MLIFAKQRERRAAIERHSVKRRAAIERHSVNEH